VALKEFVVKNSQEALASATIIIIAAAKSTIVFFHTIPPFLIS
jgi:hypothetical protein